MRTPSVPSRPLPATLALALALWVLATVASPAAGQSPAFSVGSAAGYQQGPSVQLLAEARDFARGLPVQLRLRVGRTSLEPGNAAAARRIFINNATNGTPVEHGRSWDVGVDMLVERGTHSRVWLGVRHTRFLANFRYVGGNEDFDVTSRHWGLGAGMEASYPVSPRVSLLVSAGGEFYFASRLQGHDTSYSPDGDDVNPREDYVYADADEAVEQPRLRPVVLVGFTYRVGR